MWIFVFCLAVNGTLNRAMTALEEGEKKIGRRTRRSRERSFFLAAWIRLDGRSDVRDASLEDSKNMTKIDFE